MATITAAEALEFIRTGSKKRFFSVEFIKRGNGQLRKMVAKYGVRKYVFGVGANYDAEEHNLVRVWDSEVARKEGGWRAYRSIPVENIVRIKINKEWVYVERMPRPKTLMEIIQP